MPRPGGPGHPSRARRSTDREPRGIHRTARTARSAVYRGRVTTETHARLAATYDDFGRRWAHGTSPLYEDWAIGIAQDDDLLSRLGALPKRLQQPNLVFAASRWAGAPLAAFAEWSEWTKAHWTEVVAVGEARTVQTNEANRCATLLPVLSRIEGPVALLETGAAAGLCRLPDRDSVDYDTPEGLRRIDPDTGPTPFSLACALDEVRSLPSRMPDVVWRQGIDLHPIDPADPAAIDWLATLIWPGPDHDPRVARLRGAAAVAASDPPPILQGDILEVLPDVAAQAPADATLVVFHSAVLLYLDAEQRERFARIVGGLGDLLGRPVVWLSNETRGTLAAIDAQLPVDAVTSGRFVQTVDGRPVALAGQHGAVYETAPFGALRTA